MNYQTISEVYAANDAIREKLKAVLAGLTDVQADVLPDGEKWTIAQIVEHLSIVEDGMMRISAKLLKQAEASGAASADGSIKFSGDFLGKISEARHARVEAPERVRPTGTKTIAESLVKLDENRQNLHGLRPLFESIECSDFKFPHPAFGDLTAHEWLLLVGGHEARHLRQIQKILEKIQ
jgi:hypothetical protein